MPPAQHLLVDGANIMHAWPELRRMLQRDRDAARSRLVAALSAVHDVEGWRVTVVFDGRGDRLQVEQPGAAATFALIYTPSSVTADSVIEQWVAKSPAPTACTVATDDVAERRLVAALGATVCSSEELQRWCVRAAGRQSAAVAAVRDTTEKEWKK